MANCKATEFPFLVTVAKKGSWATPVPGSRAGSQRHHLCPTQWTLASGVLSEPALCLQPQLHPMQNSPAPFCPTQRGSSTSQGTWILFSDSQTYF